jgi:hypothetical protein
MSLIAFAAHQTGVDARHSQRQCTHWVGTVHLLYHGFLVCLATTSMALLILEYKAKACQLMHPAVIVNEGGQR